MLVRASTNLSRPLASIFWQRKVSNQTKITMLPSRSIADAVARRIRARYRALRGRPVDVYAYDDAMRHFLEDAPAHVTRYPCVIPGWDNTPRSGIHGVVFHGATPELFARHVADAVAQVSAHDTARRIVFVKSWNEWAEGNYMEPDQRYGSAFLAALRDATALPPGNRAALRHDGGRLARQVCSGGS